MTRQPPGTCSSPVHGVLEQLRGVRSTGDGQWQACCPAHEDGNPSLSISIGDEGRVLLHCHVGCAFASIVNALCLEPRNLFAENGNGRTPYRNSNVKAKRQLPPPNRWAETERFAAALTAELAQELADDLGLPVSVLENLDIGWSEARTSWSFSEHDANGRVIGISFRDREGHKVAGKGHKRGLTVPKSLATLPDPVLLVEGPSDVLASLSMDLAAVGRPSARGGVDHIAEFLRDREVLVVGENDRKADGSWPGRDGAERVAEKLADAWGRDVSWVMPPEPAKDVRDWLARQDENPDDPGPRLLEALRASAQTVEPPEVSLPPSPLPSRPPSPLSIPPPPTGTLTRDQAKARQRDAFRAWEAGGRSMIVACVALSDLLRYGGLDALGDGSDPLPLAWFAEPWDVSVERVRQLAKAGGIWRVLPTIVGTDPLITDQLLESHFRPLTKLADPDQQLEALLAACQIARRDHADEQTRRRAEGKRETRLRLKARHVKRAVTQFLPTAPVATTAAAADAMNLWKALAAARDLARITPGVPGDVSAAIEEAHQASRTWARTFKP